MNIRRGSAPGPCADWRGLPQPRLVAAAGTAVPSGFGEENLRLNKQQDLHGRVLRRMAELERIITN